jgi:two-component system alkaline phosphatase synthesis response regulator PhoP
MENKKYKILLVDDEVDILEFIGYNLKRKGFTVYTAQDGRTAIELAKKVRPHLILLDVMMPEMDGIETCEEMKNIPGLSDTIIAFLTARSEDYSQIAGFEAGADDYITKPIKPKLLISRVSALLKRYQKTAKIETEEDSDVLKVGNIVIDKEKHVVVVEGEKLILPRKEFNLLLLLVSKPEKVFVREDIYKTVWGNDVIVGDRTIDVHIRKLREKIGESHIKTIKGVGYKFVI